MAFGWASGHGTPQSPSLACGGGPGRGRIVMPSRLPVMPAQAGIQTWKASLALQPGTVPQCPVPFPPPLDTPAPIRYIAPMILADSHLRAVGPCVLGVNDCRPTEDLASFVKSVCGSTDGVYMRTAAILVWCIIGLGVLVYSAHRMCFFSWLAETPNANVLKCRVYFWLWGSAFIVTIAFEFYCIILLLRSRAG